MVYVNRRGNRRFDPEADYVFTKAVEWSGARVEMGSSVPAGTCKHLMRRLFDQRVIEFADIGMDAPDPVPPLTRPVKEIIDERVARDPEFRAALLDEMQAGGQKIDAAIELPDGGKTIDSVWRDMFDDPIVIHAHEELSLALVKAKKGAFGNWPSLHHKTLVRIANECGGDVSSKDDAISHLAGLVSGDE